MIEKKMESVGYTIITYLVTYACWWSLALSGVPVTDGGTVSTILYALGGWAPTIIALLIPVFSPGRDRSGYYRRFFRFRIPVRWYFVPLLPALISVLLSYWTIRAFVEPAVQALKVQPLYMIIPLFLMMIPGGGLEELGWRGILVHNLRKLNPVLISIAVGIVWGCWHIPMFFIRGEIQYHSCFFPFLISMVSFSFITTALYLRSGSVVPCVIAHACINAFGMLGYWYGTDCEAAYLDGFVKLLVAVVFFAAVMQGNQSERKQVRNRPISNATDDRFTGSPRQS